MRRAVAVLVVFALVSGGASATALAGPTESERIARRDFQEGEAHFKAGRFAPALERYQAGYDELPLPGFLINIAQCHRRLGELAKARATYQKFMMVAPDSPHLAEVRALIAELDKLIADLDGPKEATGQPASSPIAATSSASAGPAVLALAAPVSAGCDGVDTRVTGSAAHRPGSACGQALVVLVPGGSGRRRRGRHCRRAGAVAKLRDDSRRKPRDVASVMEPRGARLCSTAWLALPLSAMAFAGCQAGSATVEPGAVLLRIESAPGAPQPDELRIWIYADQGALWKNTRIPSEGRLVPDGPDQLGTVFVQPGDVRGTLRVHVRGLFFGVRVLDAVLTIAPTDRRGTTAVALKSAIPPDADGDAVPDAIDDCPSAADPAQNGCPGCRRWGTRCRRRRGHRAWKRAGPRRCCARRRCGHGSGCGDGRLTSTPMQGW